MKDDIKGATAPGGAPAGGTEPERKEPDIGDVPPLEDSDIPADDILESGKIDDDFLSVEHHDS